MNARRLAVRAAVAFAVGVATLLGVASPASAHASLVSTDPSADQVVDAVPDQVTMTFTEAVTALPGSVEVYGPDGERVDSGTPSTSADSTTVGVALDPGGEGTYTVSPVFGVPEKGEPLGVPQFARFVAEAELPVVGLGGIGPDEAPAVRSAGAVGVAVIRALRDAEDVVEAARRLAPAPESLASE